MNNSPWDIAYELAKADYSKEHIDEMILCEVQEIIEIYTTQFTKQIRTTIDNIYK